MTNPTPKYNVGDLVEVSHKKTEGEIVSRSYSEENNSWIYQIYRADGDRQIGVYQEKNISQ